MEICKIYSNYSRSRQNFLSSVICFDAMLLGVYFRHKRIRLSLKLREVVNLTIVYYRLVNFSPNWRRESCSGRIFKMADSEREAVDRGRKAENGASDR